MRFVGYILDMKTTANEIKRYRVKMSSQDGVGGYVYAKGASKAEAMRNAVATWGGRAVSAELAAAELQD